MMMTVFRILNVEQEIAKTKILFLIFQLVPTAAMTLFQVRCSKDYLCYEIIVGKGFSNGVTWLYLLKDISTPDFSTPSFISRPFNPGLFNQGTALLEAIQISKSYA